MKTTTETPKEISAKLTQLVKGVLSAPRKAADPDNQPFDRIRIRRLTTGLTEGFQLEQFRGTKVFHRNISKDDLEIFLDDCLGTIYTRAEFQLPDETLHVMANRRAELSLLRKKGMQQQTPPIETSHNRKKNYCLEEGTPVPFLVDLGIMTANGMVIKARYDKFKQINRFLEFIEDIVPTLRTDDGKEVTIVDFGCGKSYLTFAVHYYLTEIQKIPVRIIGLDLKKDVIDNCSRLARKYGCEGLSFEVGDIASFSSLSSADMVLSLHACDTATDAVLAKAIFWKTRIILAVPCCQHEVNGQLTKSHKNNENTALFTPLLRHGIIKERFAALLTDALRSQLLEQNGYSVQILEFIDMTHTPKNLLIRAIRLSEAKKSDTPEKETSYEKLRSFFEITPSLETLLAQKKAK